MKRILVADDSVTIQKVIALTFADEAFEVQSVGTGAEALELAKSWKPDIVLADVIMPQMNGYELCRAVKQQQETGSIPVLLLAGTFEAFDEEEARSVGANDFITKPFESGELIEKVKALIGERPVPSQPEKAAAPASVPVDADAAAGTGSPQPPDMPAPAPGGASSEPDIWDILSETGDEVRTRPEGDQPPGFRPIETAGVVDVGSFDVGIGRPESQPAPPYPPATPPPEPRDQGAGGGSAVTAGSSPAAGPSAEAEERSRVENMEKDFFGFETGAVEEVPETDILEDTVEEITFDMEPPEAVPAAQSEEVSFVIPQPADDQPVVTGETISPGLPAPEPPQAFETERAHPVPGRVEAMDLTGGSPPDQVTAPEPPQPQVQVPPPASAAAGTPTEKEPYPPIDFGAGRPEGETHAASPYGPEGEVEIEESPMEESPLELSVDLSSELPEEYSPGPDRSRALDEPAGAEPQAALPADEVPSPPGAVHGMPDDAAIRRMIEEKVEKIAWEVVPEMAEVIIREAIQKIKNGS